MARWCTWEGSEGRPQISAEQMQHINSPITLLDLPPFPPLHSTLKARTQRLPSSSFKTKLYLLFFRRILFFCQTISALVERGTIPTWRVIIISRHEIKKVGIPTGIGTSQQSYCCFSINF